MRHISWPGCSCVGRGVETRRVSEHPFFRANVGAVICEAAGQVLAFERSDVPGAWQLPQGGIDADEEPEAAVLREIQEEAGIVASRIEALGRHPRLLAYELPRDLRSRKTGRGQVQYWYYFRADAAMLEPAIVLGSEFRAWRWLELRDLAADVVTFRRPVYEELVNHFEAAVRPRL